LPVLAKRAAKRHQPCPAALVEGAAAEAAAAVATKIRINYFKLQRLGFILLWSFFLFNTF
jgi:hypothetical protein